MLKDYTYTSTWNADAQLCINSNNVSAFRTSVLSPQNNQLYETREIPKKFVQIPRTIDDVRDDPTFIRHSHMIHSLYVRGRHNMLRNRTATLTFNAIHVIIRIDATKPYCCVWAKQIKILKLLQMRRQRFLTTYYLKPVYRCKDSTLQFAIGQNRCQEQERVARSIC